MLEEIMASVPDHPQREEDKTPKATVQPHLGGSHSSRSSAPHRRRNDNSMVQSLAKVCTAHQKVLATVATLEEEIERLSQTRNHSQSRARSKSRDHQRPSRERQKKRCCQVQLQMNLSLASLPTPRHNQGRRGPKVEALTWRNCQN